MPIYTKSKKENSLRPRNTEFVRTQFLRDFMQAVGVSVGDAARFCNVTRATCAHWWQPDIDDVKLSHVFTIVEKAGYECEFFLTREPGEVSGKVRVRVDDFISLPGERYLPGRLAFITVALKRYGLSITEVARRMNLAVTSLRYYLTTDDIMLSRLFQMAEVMGMSLMVSFRPVATEETLTAPSKFVFDMTIHRERKIVGCNTAAPKDDSKGVENGVEQDV